MLSSGEFSKIANLSIKALRLYHEAGILVPKLVDKDTGYRFYDYDNVERARVIVLLRQMMFSVDDIKDLLRNCSDDIDAVAFLEIQRTRLENKIREMKQAKSALDKIVEGERLALALIKAEAFPIVEKTLPPVSMAGIRVRGAYADIGKVFAKLGRQAGGMLSGKPFGLFYDEEYRESDADFEGCFPVNKQKAISGISFRELPQVRAVTLIYQGSYSTAGRSYAKIHGYINERGYKSVAPSREIYIKGPGLIFKGRLNNYVTEIQMPIEIAGVL